MKSGYSPSFGEEKSIAVSSINISIVIWFKEYLDNNNINWYNLID